MIFYHLAYIVLTSIASGLIASVLMSRINRKRRVNSIRYRRWLNYKPEIIDTKWEEV